MSVKAGLDSEELLQGSWRSLMCLELIYLVSSILSDLMRWKTLGVY